MKNETDSRPRSYTNMAVYQFIRWQIEEAGRYDVETMARRANGNISDAYVQGIITTAESNELHRQADQVLYNIGYKQAEARAQAAVKVGH